jgi:hypothetical protein
MPSSTTLITFRLNPSVNSEPSWATPISAPTDTRLTFETVATRTPAVITGTAIGSSTLRNRPMPLKPIAVAAARTSSGTEFSPSATTRTSSATV